MEKCVINGFGCYLKHEPRVMPWGDYIIQTWGGSNPKTNSVRLLLPGNKITSCTHTRRQIVRRGDVTLSQYSSGLNLKKTLGCFIASLLCVKVCRSSDGGEPFLCPPPFGIQFEKKVRCVIAKTKPQYQSDKKTDKERPFCVYFERKSGLKARERLSIYF